MNIDDYLKFNIKGLFYEYYSGEVEPEVPMPEMMRHDGQLPAKFQAFVSAYLLDSLTESYLKGH